MIASIYHLLSRMGYEHPIHPPLTHILIGLVVGAFVFGVIALILGRPKMVLTARHCIIFAYLSLFPVALLGFMDWQHYFAGTWLLPIKIKLGLTLLFFVLSTIGIVLGGRPARSQKVTNTIYGLCFATLIGLGYYGGDLAFGCRSPSAPEEFRAGARIFSEECGSCHPQGGNIINPNAPLRGAKQLTDLDSFVAYLRNPVRADGSRGFMPPFPIKKLSEEEQKDLYSYIMNVLENPRRE